MDPAGQSLLDGAEVGARTRQEVLQGGIRLLDAREHAAEVAPQPVVGLGQPGDRARRAVVDGRAQGLRGVAGLGRERVAAHAQRLDQRLAGLGQCPLDRLPALGQRVGELEHRPVDDGVQARDVTFHRPRHRAPADVDALDQGAAALLDGAHERLRALGEPPG